MGGGTGEARSERGEGDSEYGARSSIGVLSLSSMGSKSGDSGVGVVGEIDLGASSTIEFVSGMGTEGYRVVLCTHLRARR